MKNVEVEALADGHVHLREGPVVQALIEASIAGGADVLGPMPNTDAGLTTAKQVTTYIERAKSLVPTGARMTFVPFVMITEKTTKADIDACIEAGIRHAKVYPLNRTTKSHNGVERYGSLLPIIEYCGRGMYVHFHPENPWMLFGNRDAEFGFLQIMKMFMQETEAVLIWEHGTDARCIPFWKEMAVEGRFYVTLTAHHLLTNEDETFGEVRATCKPPIKQESDRLGLIDLVKENHEWVMAGGDSAFHPVRTKHTAKGRCSCGALTAHNLLPLYAHALQELFATEAGLETFIGFTSQNFRHAFRIDGPVKKHTLVWEETEIPESYLIGPEVGMPFMAGQKIACRLL